MRRFMKTILLFVAFLFGNTFIGLAQADGAAGFLLAFGTFGTNFVALFVVPTTAFETANVVGAPLFVDARRQCLDTEIESNHTVFGRYFFCSLADKRGKVVSSGISTNGYLFETLWWCLSKGGKNSGKTFVLPLPPVGRRSVFSFTLMYIAG